MGTSKTIKIKNKQKQKEYIKKKTKDLPLNKS